MNLPQSKYQIGAQIDITRRENSKKNRALLIYPSSKEIIEALKKKHKL